MQQQIYNAYVQFLNKELVPAMGCTEPIAIAYAAALARQTLGAMPTKVEMFISPNVIKNVKCVVVPYTGGLRGISAAAAAGIVAGDANAKLEVLSAVQEDDIPKMQAYLKQTEFILEPTESNQVLDICFCVHHEQDQAYVRIAGHHTHIVRIAKNGEMLFEQPLLTEQLTPEDDRSLLSIEQIVEFADCVNIDDVKEVLDRQIACNTAIAEEGLTGHWGAAIGRVLMDAYGNSVHNKAKAYAAAGSDARMSGGELPVVINSGSGNQGMTTSLPVIVYAREMGVSDEMLYRALVVANLVTIHLKTGIGRLSAYCGVTSAGCGAGAGVSYLHGGKYDAIAHTIVNAIAINSGMICDGAKASCAGKIASAVEAGLLGVQMQLHNEQFYGGDGIIVKGVENTIRNIGYLARVGMKKTDEEIIQMMIGKTQG